MQLLVLFGLTLTAGLFLILADVLRLPLLSTERAMIAVARREKKAAKSLEAYLLGFAVKLSKHLLLDEYRRIRMKNTLDAAGLSMTPETYEAYALVKSGMVLVGSLLCLAAIPLLFPVLAFLGIMVYFKEMKRADEKLAKKRGEMERDLPRFVAIVEQELRASRDVLSMLESYKRHAGEAFASELDILTADMRSSSYEAALTRFEARINSPMLSDVVRGLIGVLRGDNSGVYFQMLSHDLKQMELQKLKAEAMKIPPKIRVFSFVMLMCFLFTWLAIIGFEIFKSMSGMF